MNFNTSRQANNLNEKGFTLIEVMVVVVLIGIMASLIRFTTGTNSEEESLKFESAKFAAIFEVAAEYGLLNNMELGLIVEQNSYHFVAYDGTHWVDIPRQEWQAHVRLPREVIISLELDDLPIEEPLLFDSESLREQDEENFRNLSKEEQKQKKIPQIYMLSGGDITPFSLTFTLIEQLAEYNPISYRVTGIETTPLLIEGPFFDED